MLQFARLFDVFNHQVLVTAAEGSLPCLCQQCQKSVKVPGLRITTHVFRNNADAQLQMDILCPDTLQQSLALRKFESYHVQRAFSVLQDGQAPPYAPQYLQTEIQALKLERFGY